MFCGIFCESNFTKVDTQDQDVFKMTVAMNEAVETRQTRSKRKVRFEEPVADVRPRPRREAAASKPVVAEDPAVPSEMEVRVACGSALWAHQATHTFPVCVCI